MRASSPHIHCCSAPGPRSRLCVAQGAAESKSRAGNRRLTCRPRHLRPTRARTRAHLHGHRSGRRSAARGARRTGRARPGAGARLVWAGRVGRGETLGCWQAGACRGKGACRFKELFETADGGSGAPWRAPTARAGIATISTRPSRSPGPPGPVRLGPASTDPPKRTPSGHRPVGGDASGSSRSEALGTDISDSALRPAPLQPPRPPRRVPRRVCDCGAEGDGCLPAAAPACCVGLRPSPRCGRGP